MHKQHQNLAKNQSGFITMIVLLLIVVLAVLYLAYHKVSLAQK